VKCDQCQTENKEGAKFCAKCGTVLSAIQAKPMAETRQCPACGKALKLDAKFCGGCGHKFEQTVSAQEPKVEIVVTQPEVMQIQPDVKTVLPVKMVEQAKQESIVESSKPCPKCGKALKMDAKFCGGCGHKFEQAATAQAPKVEITAPQPAIKPVQPEVKVVPPAQIIAPAEVIAELTKPCPKCGKALKLDAKFCGGCGHNFAQAVGAPAPNVEATITRSETRPVQPEITPPEKIIEQTKPKSMPENVQAEKSGIKFNAVSTAKKGRPIAVIAGGIGAVVAIVAGLGFFYYKSHNGQAVAAKVEQVPTVLSQPASAQVPVAVMPPSSIPASSPAPVSVVAPVQTTAPVVQPVVEPVSSPAPPVANVPKKTVIHAKQKGETQDDKKLLNAIDQYMDKQK